MPQAAIQTITTNSALQTAAPRDLDPKDVIAEVIGEELLDDPDRIAEMVIERLRDAGFKIVPAEEPGLKAEVQRLQAAKRWALLLADERAKEAAQLRLENDRLKAQLAE
jgi:hypothetical protein